MACSLTIDPINQLEENLQCTVCLEVLKDPRTLPCCHSFCKDCLEGVVKTCRDKALRVRPIRQIPCPTCRATFTLDPDKHVADMPRNHFICNLVKATAVLDRGIGVPCSHNCTQSYSVARCVTCEKFLCRECLTIHDSYRGHNGHSVLMMEELSKPENRKKINDKMYCDEHSGMILKVYCKTCDQLICRDCMHFNHLKQGHSCLLVKDVANNYKELLASKNKKMEDTLTEGNAVLERLRLATERLDQNSENVKSQIAQKKDLVMKTVAERLEEKTKTLFNKVDEIHKVERAKLDRKTEETKLHVENVKGSVQLSKKLVDQGTEEEIISSQKMMLDNAHNLLTKRKNYSVKVPTPVNLKYTASAVKKPINEEILRELANSLGEVNRENEDKGEKRQTLFQTLQQQTYFMTDKSETNSGWDERKDQHNRPVSYYNICPDPKQSKGKKTEDDECSIQCLSEFTKKKTLDKCDHSFCTKSIDWAFKTKKQCPTCSTVYGPLTGNQPPGKMLEDYRSTPLPGFKSCGTIVISYKFSSGIQGPGHPNPGKPYTGTSRTAYLPDNEEGRKVLKLLKKAFQQKLTFTIGRSTTTGRELKLLKKAQQKLAFAIGRSTTKGRDDCVTWNDIHHKTSMTGGSTGYGYPDPDYLKRVQDELAAKGITE